MRKENMKKGRKKVELSKLTFRKLYKKLKNKIEISERATYNISVQLQSCDNTLEDEECFGYLTRFNLWENNVSGNTFYISLKHIVFNSPFSLSIHQ